MDDEDGFNKEFQKYTCKSVTLAKNDATIATGKPFDIIQFWTSPHMTTKYKRLAKVAKSVLAVPLSSSASERLFSAAALVLERKRGSLLSSGTGSKYVVFGEWLHTDLVTRPKDAMIEEGIFPGLD